MGDLFSVLLILSIVSSFNLEFFVRNVYFVLDLWTMHFKLNRVRCMVCTSLFTELKRNARMARSL